MTEAQEWQMVWTIPLRFIPTILLATAYAIGGRGPKWVRRWLGGGITVASVLALAAVFGTLTWRLAIVSPVIFLGLVMGYGGEDLLEKFIRRLGYGALLGLSGLLIGFAVGNVALGSLQFGLAVLASLYLGIFNPTVAVKEEAMIATLSVVLIPFMI